MARFVQGSVFWVTERVVPASLSHSDVIEMHATREI